ncbi:hypothetical protein MRX96_050090, partial [Rhipicephalus microplus]
NYDSALADSTIASKLKLNYVKAMTKGDGVRLCAKL